MLSRFALKNRHTIYALSIGAVIFGVIAYVSLPIQLFPDTAPPLVNVLTSYPGAAAEDLEKMIEFFRNFTDRCHHAKEEGHLFVKMQERGMSGESGPIGVMLQEHEEGRQSVRAIAKALPSAEKGDSSAIASVRSNLQAYIELLRAHIDKEDNVLYPMADRLLTSADQQTLGEAFEQVEAQEMGDGIHERYHQLAHDLADG